MKLVKTILTLAMIFLGSIPSESVLADHGHGGSHGGHVHFGFFIGNPWPWYDPWPWYGYPPPYYYPPPTVVMSSLPPAYIEKSDEQVGPEEAQAYWYYYCAEAKAYYPYVKQCSGGWQRVSPQPSNP